MVFNHNNNAGGGGGLSASMVHNSSPAPMRRGKGHFGFDSSISSPNDVKRALFDASTPQGSQPKKSKTEGGLEDFAEAEDGGEEEEEEIHEVVEMEEYSSNVPQSRMPSTGGNHGTSRSKAKIIQVFGPPSSEGGAPRETLTSSSLVCNFEESVFNGRIYPVSQVDGFFAKIGASGSFHPRHLTLPVRVYYYSLCDNLKISSPYLGHIDIGKKGYRVPDKGTIQVTLFNPLGTVVKMFVVVYNLSDMPSSSQTFIRQRTLYMPSDLPIDATDSEPQKWLRYVIHLRFASSKSGKIYLHTDIRMIIFNKSDLDTATDFCRNREFELRSYTRTPNNPKFSPRK